MKRDAHDAESRKHSQKIGSVMGIPGGYHSTHRVWKQPFRNSAVCGAQHFTISTYARTKTCFKGPDCRMIAHRHTSCVPLHPIPPTLRHSNGLSSVKGYTTFRRCFVRGRSHRIWGSGPTAISSASADCNRFTRTRRLRTLHGEGR